MCFVDAATSNIEIGSIDFESICYKCRDCSSTFKAIGKKVKCPTCESTRVERV
jgi:Zn finger protein HypA/HybF involved in hydrogenase expression